MATETLDTRLFIYGDNATPIRALLDERNKEICSKKYTTAVESILMDYIRLTGWNPKEEKKNTKRK